MNRLSRTGLILTGALSAALVAGPALAATATPTSLTLKAAKSSVAHNTKDSLTGTLKDAKSKALAGETVVLEKRAYGTKSFTVAATKKTNSKGQVVLTVTPGSRKGQKEQYELVYKGSATHKASHSQVITVSVS
jgi:hypothetical protein